MKMIMTLALLSILSSSSFAASSAIADRTLKCVGTGVEMTLETASDGVASWDVQEKKDAVASVFMGFISGDDSQDLNKEFYSSDLGSDFHFKNNKVDLTVTDGQTERHFTLTCH